MRPIRNQEIEDLAQSRLAHLERESGRPLSPPIPIDRIAKKVLGLDYLWEPIDELPGDAVSTGLSKPRRRPTRSIVRVR